MTPITPSTHPCPDLEELAAFVDGRLEGGDRAAVVEHLASCEDCYEVYAETLRVGEDLEAETADGELAPVVRHPRSLRWAWPAAAAALAAAAAVVLVLRLPEFLSTSRSSGELVAAAGVGAQTRLEDGWQVHDWSTTRGENRYLYLSAEERSFRVGVRVVDLRSALALGDRDTARSIVKGEIVPLLEAEKLGISFFYESLAKDLESEASTAELIEICAQAEQALVPDDETETYFELGKWVEAGRLAALTGNVRYFEKWSLRRFLRSIQIEGLPEELAELIAEFEALLQAGPTAEALPDFEETLEKIIALRKRPA